MTKDKTTEDTETFRKIQEALDQWDSFTEHDRVALRKMIDLWRTFEILGKVANIARNVIIYLAFLFMVWYMPFEDTLKVVKKFFGFG